MGGPDGRYLGIQRFRFYIKCSICSRTITFLTDPENTDYEMESGGSRNYEVYRDKKKTEEELAAEKEKDEKEDPMKALENRVLDSQREMADLDNLEEIRAMNRKHLKLMSSSDGGGFDAKAVLKALDDRIQEEAITNEEELNEHGITEEEEKLVKSIKFRKKQQQNTSGGEQLYSGGKRKLDTIVRLSADDEKREDDRRKKELALLQQKQKEAEDERKKTIMAPAIKIKVKRKKVDANTAVGGSKQPKESESSATSAAPTGAGLAGLLGGYGSSSDSD